MKKIFFILGCAFFFFIMLLVIFGPVDSSKENSARISGVVVNVSEGGVKDAVFELKDDNIVYYINRALENGFTLSALKRDFIGKKVTVYYSKNWTPLAPFGTTAKHISRLEYGNKIIYTEF